MFGPDGNNLLPAAALYKKNILALRGRFRPVTKVNEEMYENSLEMFVNERHVDKKDTIVIFEITMVDLTTDGEIDEKDFMDRARLLGSLGETVLITNFKEYYKLVEYSKIPLVRPASFMIKGKKTTNLKNNQNIEQNLSPLSIMVGFYYNKYNAELDLPGILLNDSSLTDEVNAEVVSVVYMKKQGFRINISPLTKTNAIRACEKIKALGQLCEISK